MRGAHRDIQNLYGGYAAEAPQLVDGTLCEARVLQSVPGLKHYPEAWNYLQDQLQDFERFYTPGGVMEPSRAGLAAGTIEGSIHSTVSKCLGFFKSKLGVSCPTLEHFTNGRLWYIWYTFQFSSLTSAGNSRKHCNATDHILNWLMHCVTDDEDQQLCQQLHSMRCFVQQLASSMAKMERAEERYMVRQPLKRQQAMAQAMAAQLARLFSPPPPPVASSGIVDAFVPYEVGGDLF